MADGKIIQGVRWIADAAGRIVGYRNPVSDKDEDLNAAAVQGVVSDDGNADFILAGDSLTQGAMFQVAVQSITSTGGVATAQATGHGTYTGARVAIFSNNGGSEFVGQYTVTRTGANTFTFPYPTDASVTGNLGVMHLQRHVDGGYATWLRALLRGAGLIAVNAGISGESSADIAARFSRDVLSSAAPNVILMCGTNDPFESPTAITPEQTVTNIEAMRAMCASAGKRLTVIIPPACGAGYASFTTLRNYLVELRMRLLDYRRGRTALRVVDGFGASVDPIAASPGAARASWTRTDNLHLSPSGAYQLAALVYAALPLGGRTTEPLIASSAETSSVVAAHRNRANVLWTNATGGTVGTGATGSAAAGMRIASTLGTPATGSIALRTDGAGYDQVLVGGNGSANNNSMQIQSALSGAQALTTLFAAGDLVRVACNVRLANGTAAAVKGINATIEGNITLAGDGGSTFNVLSSAAQYSAIGGVAPDALDLPMVFPDFLMPAGSYANLYLNVQVTFAGGGTADATLAVGRISYEKLN